MSRNTLIVALSPEVSECCGHVLSYPLALGIGIREGRDASQLELPGAVAACNGLEDFILGGWRDVSGCAVGIWVRVGYNHLGGVGGLGDGGGHFAAVYQRHSIFRVYAKGMELEWMGYID